MKATAARVSLSDDTDEFRAFAAANGPRLDRPALIEARPDDYLPHLLFAEYAATTVEQAIRRRAPRNCRGPRRRAGDQLHRVCPRAGGRPAAASPAAPGLGRAGLWRQRPRRRRCRPAGPGRFAIGPLLRGNALDPTAIPEIRDHAGRLAEALLQRRKARTLPETVPLFTGRLLN